MRTFIAIDFNASLKSTLEDLILKLKATGADIRWTQAGGLHLTLKFLGEVDEGRAAVIKGILGSVAGRHSSFPLAFKGTGAFPDERNPRVLWIGFAAEPALLALQEDLESELEREGHAREKRPYHPHLTLGRIKGPERVRSAVVELGKIRTESLGGMPVRKFAFFESRLRPEGPEHRVIEEFGLS